MSVSKINKKKFKEYQFKLQNVINEDDEKIREFINEIKEYEEKHQLFIDCLENELKEEELINISYIISHFPHIVQSLLNEMPNLPFTSFQCIVDVGRTLKFDVEFVLEELYLKNREDSETGPMCALYMLETSHPKAIETIIDQFSMDIDNSLEMSYGLKYFFEDSEGMEEEFRNSSDPQIHFVYEKYMELMELFEEDYNKSDRIEFFSREEFKIEKLFVRNFAYEISNGIANTILILKNESDIEIIDYSSLKEFARQLLPPIFKLIVEECDGLLVNPDEMDEDHFSCDIHKEKWSDLYFAYRDYLIKIYDDHEYYNIDYFTWKMIIIIKEILSNWKLGSVDEDNINKFIIDFAVEVETFIEEGINIEKNSLEKLSRLPYSMDEIINE